eukprot:10764182-Prorocentrum_lima.AAC.1
MRGRWGHPTTTCHTLQNKYPASGGWKKAKAPTPCPMLFSPDSYPATAAAYPVGSDDGSPEFKP